jgi:hypothetical protein
VDRRLDQVEAALTLLARRFDRFEEALARIEETRVAVAPSGLPALPPLPSRPVRYSPQFGQMVELDADGREIPPE